MDITMSPPSPEVAALRIQCAWRSYVARTRAKRLRDARDLQHGTEIEETEAALTIQCAMRVYLAKTRVQRIQEERHARNVYIYANQAAITIQSAWRGYYIRSQKLIDKLAAEVRDVAEAGAGVQLPLTAGTSSTWRSSRPASYTTSSTWASGSPYTESMVPGSSSTGDFEDTESQRGGRHSGRGSTSSSTRWQTASRRQTRSSNSVGNRRLHEMMERHYSEMQEDDECGLEHYGAMVIQAAWRAYRARRVLSARRTKLHFEEASQEMALMELIERRIVLSEREYEWSDMVVAFEDMVVRNQAAIALQRFFRSFSDTVREPSTVPDSSRWQRAAGYGRHTARLNLQHEAAQQPHRAARTIQSAWRCFEARAELSFRAYDRARAYAAELIAQEHRAAGLIQRHWLRHRERRAVRRIKAAFERAAAVREAQALRREREVARAAEWEAMQNHNAVLIQRNVRRHLAKREVAGLRHAWHERAAVRIQAAVRRHLAQQQLPGRRLNRKERLVLRMQNEAATLIQAVWKGARVRALISSWKETVQNAVWAKVRTLQRLVRGWLVRSKKAVWQQQMEQRKRTAAATAIQSGFRGHAQRQAYRLQASQRRADRERALESDERMEAAVAVQAWVRRVRASLDTRDLRRRRRAASKVQAFWRHWRPIQEAKRTQHRKLREQQKKRAAQYRYEAAVVIQSCWRRHRERSWVLARLGHRRRQRAQIAVEHAAHAAAIAIQSHVRTWLFKAQGRRMRAEFIAGARLRGFWRVCKARARLMRLKMERELWCIEERRRAAAVTAQRIARGWLVRTAALKQNTQREHAHACATTIQCAWRSAAAQRLAEGHRQTRLQELRQQRVLGCVQTLQRITRGCQARLRVMPQWQRKRSAGDVIGRAWRSACARVELRRRREERRAAEWASSSEMDAVDVQRICRGWLAKKRVRALKEQVSLARTRQRWREQCVRDLQRVGRGALARQRTRPEHVRQHNAATDIERVARSWLTRVRLQRQRQQQQRSDALAKIGPAVLQFAADRRYRLAREKEGRKMAQVALRAAQRTEIEQRLVLVHEAADAWAALTGGAAEEVARIRDRAVPKKEALPLRAPRRHLVAIQDSSAEGLFMKGWLEWMAKMGCADDLKMERLLTKEATARKRAYQQQKQEWAALVATEARDGDLTRIAQREFPDAWHREQQLDRQRATARTHKLKRDVAQAYDPQWVRHCLDLDLAAQEQAIAHGTDPDAVLPSLRQPKEDLQRAENKLQASWIQAAKRERAAFLAPAPARATPRSLAPRKGAASLLPSISPPAPAERNAAHPDDGSRRCKVWEPLVAQNAPQVSVLDLRHQGLTDSALLPLLLALKGNTVVHTVLLDGNRLTDATGIELSKLLQSNAALQVLSLSGNADITDLSAKHWLNALKINTTLKDLQCIDTNVSPQYSSQLTYLLNFAAPQTHLLALQNQVTLSRLAVS